jgi:hypothetical protein
MLVFLPLILFIHNVEKIFYIKYWLAQHPTLYPIRLSYYVPVMFNPAEYYQNFQVILILSIIIPSFFMLYALFSRHQRLIMYLLLFFAFSFLMNCIQHVGIAILFKSINPGLFTSVALLLPFSFIMFHEIKKNWQLSEIPKQAYYLLPLSLCLPVFNFIFHNSMNIITMF